MSHDVTASDIVKIKRDGLIFSSMIANRVRVISRHDLVLQVVIDEKKLRICFFFERVSVTSQSETAQD